jgi:CelD/BcsL family acetyltransferase involved in cellulose biosynthesis
VSERTLTAHRPATSTAGWSVQIRRGAHGWDGLQTDWDDLVARCSAATAFQSYAWLHSWWCTYGRPGRLQLVLVRYGGRLVAAAPLMHRWSAGCPVLTPLGGTVSDFGDVLVDDAWRREATSRLIEALLGEPGWDAMDVFETRPDAVAGTALWDAWPGERRWAPASVCPELPVGGIDELVAGLPKHSRKTVRYRLNQIRRAGLDVRAVDMCDADRAVADLLRLHARQWQGRGGNPHHRSPAFAEHLTRATRAMLGSAQAALLEYRAGEELVASSLMLIGRDVLGGYLYGVDPALRERVDVTTMMLADALPTAAAHGCSTMSMLRGDESHKAKCSPRRLQNRRVLLVRPGSARGLAYANGVRLARRAVLSAKRHAPWLLQARERVWRVLSSAHPHPHPHPGVGGGAR